MTQIAEYRDVKPEQFGKITVLETKANGRHEYRLVHRAPGYQCAGSMARFDCEAIGVLFEANGATNGRWFLPENEQAARALFKTWTEKED